MKTHNIINLHLKFFLICYVILTRLRKALYCYDTTTIDTTTIDSVILASTHIDKCMNSAVRYYYYCTRMPNTPVLDFRLAMMPPAGSVQVLYHYRTAEYPHVDTLVTRERVHVALSVCALARVRARPRGKA